MMATNGKLKSLYIVGSRVHANPLILWSPPILPTPPLFPNFTLSHTHTTHTTHTHTHTHPCYLQPHPHWCSFCCVFLFLWLNGWSHHIWCATLLKGMLERNIENFLKSHIYEKLGTSEMKYLKKNFQFPAVCIFDFSKSMNPCL